MASRVAIAGGIFRFGIGLYQQADSKLLQANPTIAAGDFMYSVIAADGTVGAMTQLDNTPTVSPAGGVQVVVVLSAAETTEAGATGVVNVYWQDAAGAEWCSGGCAIPIWGGSPAEVGSEMTLTSAYNAAKAAAAAADVLAQAGAALTAYNAAVPGDAMTLADNAITAGKIAADAIGASELAAGAVSEIVTAVWAAAARTLTQGAASVATAVASSQVTVYRATTWSITLTGLGSLVGYTSLWFAVKRDLDDEDVDAVVVVKKNASGTGDGLIYALGSAVESGEAGNGSITINDEATGSITITVAAAVTDDVQTAADLSYAVKVLNGGVVSLLSDGKHKFEVAGGAPLAIS